MRQLVPYPGNYLAGWRAEQYALDLMPGWQQGMQKMISTQQGEVAGKAPWSVVKITLASLLPLVLIGAAIAVYLYFQQQQ